MAGKTKRSVERLEVNVVMIEKLQLGLDSTLLIYYENKEGKPSGKLQNSMKVAGKMFPLNQVLFVPFIRR